MKKLFLISCLLFLSACSMFQKQVINEAALVLLPSNKGPDSSVIKQAVTIEKADQKHQFIAALRLEKQQSQMVALLPSGQHLFTLAYRENTLSQENFTQMEIPSAEIFNTMQFALWPEATLHEFYPSTEGWLVEVSEKERRLSRNFSGLLLKIVYEKNNDDLTIYNSLHGAENQFKIIIQTLEKSSL